MSAARGWISEEVRDSAALSRLLGSWASEDGRDLLCFVRVDGSSRTGTYVHFPQRRRPGRRVRFDIIHEDPAGERLVIKQWVKDAPGAKDEPTSRSEQAQDATLYIPTHGRTLTWIDIRGGKPVMKVHHRVKDASGRVGLSI